MFITIGKQMVDTNIENYNEDFVEEFNEHLRDHYDAFIVGEKEYSVDAVLLKIDTKEYFRLLVEYLAWVNGDEAILNKYGDPIFCEALEEEY